MFSQVFAPRMSSREVANACESLVFDVLFKDAAVLVSRKIGFLIFSSNNLTLQIISNN